MDILESKSMRRLRLASKGLPDDALQAGRLAAIERGDKKTGLAFHNEQMTRMVKRHNAETK